MRMMTDMNLLDTAEGQLITAAAMIDDVTEVLRARFWEEEPGAIREGFDADWSETEAYRGQNCNMHLTEALMAAQLALVTSRRSIGVDPRDDPSISHVCADVGDERFVGHGECEVPVPA